MIALENLAFSGRDDNMDQAMSASGSDIAQQYQLVGKTLLICEASAFRVGIPWLPPTRRVLRYRQNLGSPVEQYVRYSLVTVNTDTLESYLEDLDTLSSDPKRNHLLHLQSPTPFERYAFGILLFITFFISLFCSLASMSPNFTAALSIAGIFALLASLAGFVFSSETSRLTSFYWVLEEEVLRRRGENRSKLGQIHIYSPKPGT